MKNNNKIYLIFSIFTLALLFLAIFFIWLLFQDIQGSSNDLVSAKDRIIALNAQIKETRNFNKNYQAYKANLDKIDQLFVDPNDPVKLIEFLENTASSSRATAQVSLLTPQQEGQDFISFQVACRGGFSDVLDFSKKVEAGPYFIEIESLTIQNAELPVSGQSNVIADYSSRTVNATFVIKVFTKK